jgi:hypothetical protein
VWARDGGVPARTDEKCRLDYFTRKIVKKTIPSASAELRIA